MKHILFICCMLPAITFAQTKADYERTMKNFVKFYNNQQPDSIVAMWPESHHESMKDMWSKESIEQMTTQYGKIKSYNYLGIDTEDHVTVFMMQLSKAGEKAASFTLDKENYLGTFLFITSSDGITKLLKQAK